MALPSTSVFTNINIPSEATAFKNNVSQGLSKYQADAVKAINPVVNNLKAGVATIKSTQSKITGQITAYKSEVIESLNSITSKLTGGLLDFKDASKYIKVGPHGVSFDKQGMVGAIGNKIGYDLSSQTAFMSQLTNMANSEFNELSGGYFGNMVTTDGNGFRITKNWRDQLGNGLLSALSRTTGISSSLIDYTVTTSYNNSLLNISAQYGMSDSYSTIMDNYTDKVDAKTALINAVQYMIANGDVVSIAKVLTLIDATQYAIVNAQYPNLVSTIMANFALDNGVTSDGYPGIKASVMTIFNDIAGANWYLTSTAFGQAYDLGAVTTVSSDMKKVLLSDDTYPELIPVICCEGIFTNVNAITKFQQDFPSVPILVDA